MNSIPAFYRHEVDGGTPEIICAWCGFVLKKGHAGYKSHGICLSCRDLMKEKVLYSSRSWRLDLGFKTILSLPGRDPLRRRVDDSG